jgi:hypothetical protein
MLDRRRPGLDPLALASLLSAVAAVAAGVTLAWHHPVAPVAVLAAFLLWSVVVACRPGLWLFVVPALLPLLNFAPWTGWVVFEEFDLLLWGVAAGGYAHIALAGEALRDAPPVRRSDRVFIGMAVVFGALGVVALLRGLALPGDHPSGWFQGYTDPLNSWRVFKSLLHAALIWPLLRREIERGAGVAVRRFASGMLVGLTVVTLAVVWERLAYTGLWDFSTRYRTTALFWEMHVGGAAIDVYLALATPFVAWALWTCRSPLLWSMAAALALLTGYACLTTFSRGVYGAVVGSLVLLAVMLRWQRLPRIRWRTLAGVVLAVALCLEVAAVLGWGSFMRERISATDRDMGGRLRHWQNGLGLIRTPVDAVAGIGTGRLPGAYSQAVAERQFPGDVQFVPSAPGQPSGSVVVSGPKMPSHFNGLLTLTQRVALYPMLPYEVALDVRARTAALIEVQLCEMHLLYPRNCQSAWIRVNPDGSAWRHVVASLRGPLLDVGRAWAPRLGVFSMAVVNAGGVVEIDNISLAGPDRLEMLVNRDFSEGLARWYPSAQGFYVPWHIDNLYLELLIERGAFSLVAFLLCMGWTLRRLLGAAGRSRPIAPFLAASLCGALCVGLVSSVMDVPRVAFLLLLLALFAVEVTGDPPRRDLDPEGQA